LTPDEFRAIALALPGVWESFHMGHPDFRAGGRIFATLGVPTEDWGMVKLTLDEQEALVQIDPEGFRAVRGGWGRKGATNVRLETARKDVVEDALTAAWRGVGAKRPRAARGGAGKNHARRRR
jgi:hypothetical protein